MIHIIVDQGSRRLTYTCEVIFKWILQVEYAIHEKTVFESSATIPNANDPIIFYGIKHQSGICIPDGDLVMENDIRDFTPLIRRSGIIELFPCADSTYDLPFDIFSATFYLLTEYDKWAHPEFDHHGRYNEPACFIFKNGLHHSPLVNIYIEEFIKIIIQKYPDYRFPALQSDYEITIDVDHPWAFRYKGIKPWFGILKDVFRKDWSNYSVRMQALRGGKDPYYTFDILPQIIPKEKLKFFILVNGDSPYDSKISWKNKHFRALLRNLVRSSGSLGLHPSYYSFDDNQIIRYEKKILEEILDKKVTESRQHYLKYRYPETYRILIDAGINKDYSGCCIYDVGFRYGTVNAFPWFDLENNVMTPLILHPSMAMDVSLKDYLKLPPDQALKKLKDLIDLTYRHNGCFRLLWHNSSLSEIYGWDGWEAVFIETIAYLANKSFNPGS
jgi:hypothetical protein